MSSTCETKAEGSEGGNATFGFVGTVGLLIALLYTLMSVSLSWYVEAVLRDSALHGARAAAVDGGVLPDAVARTRALISTTLPAQYADSVSATWDGTDVVVTVHAPLPLPSVVANDAHVVVRVPRE